MNLRNRSLHFERRVVVVLSLLLHWDEMHTMQEQRVTGVQGRSIGAALAACPRGSRRGSHRGGPTVSSQTVPARGRGRGAGPGTDAWAPTSRGEGRYTVRRGTTQTDARRGAAPGG